LYFYFWNLKGGIGSFGKSGVGQSLDLYIVRLLFRALMIRILGMSTSQPQKETRRKEPYLISGLLLQEKRGFAGDISIVGRSDRTILPEL
jgi:hypothetical protein